MKRNSQRSASQPVSLSACQRKGENRNTFPQDICKDARLCARATSSLPLIFAINIIFLFLFASCVPATVPPQLAATPGPAVVITEQEYHAGAFTLRYPVGWRVISSAATSPITVIFAAPDNAAIMLFGVGANEAPMPETEAQIRTEMRQVTLKNGDTVTAILNAQADSWEIFAPLFEAAVESIN